jgi:type IV pilus assembly protein PilF
MNAQFAALVLALLAAVPAVAQNEPAKPLEEAGRINARLAMEYLKRDQLQTAQEKIEKALAQNPRDVNVQLSAGLVYERLRDVKRAERHFRQAVREDEASPEAQNAFGAFLCRNKEHAKGEEMFLKAAQNQLYRTPVVAFTNAGVCARSAGDLERAERYLRQALAVQGGYPETFAQLAGVLHERRNDLQARAFIERYLAVAPATPAMLLLGRNVELALKDESAAKAFGERLRKEFPDSEEARSLQDALNRNPG